MQEFLILNNESSCGQGHNPNHHKNPAHNELTRAGWEYSHTTRITGLDGNKFASHTYKLGNDWSISVDCRNWRLSSSKAGSGTRTTFTLGARFSKYLKRKTREILKTLPTNDYEIREGDGNRGCYRRGIVQARNAFHALELASRSGMICKPRDAKLADIDGDDQNAYLASYVAPIYGDACRWLAEANCLPIGAILRLFVP